MVVHAMLKIQQACLRVLLVAAAVQVAAIQNWRRILLLSFHLLYFLLIVCYYS